MFTLSGARVRLVEAGPGTGPLRNNPAHHVGDDLELVEARRLALARGLGRPIAWMNQTHSSRVAVLTSTPSGPRLKIDDETAPFDPADPLANIEADGLIVDARAWAQAPAAAVMTADCLPVLLAGDSGLIAAVHAGRLGLLGGILPKAVAAMRAIDDAPVRAFIAPAICGRCYEVPETMRAACAIRLPGSSSITSWGTPALDLVAAGRRQLEEAGCREVRVDPRCTFEDEHLHSYRRNRACGRNAAIIRPD